MNKLRMIAMCLFAMMVTSLRVKAQEVTITLMPGWTWISVPITEVQDFATTLGSFTPMAGDIIKSQWGNASYANGQWRGNISQFYPGYGYMYKSTRTMPVTVTFNVQQPAPQVIVTTVEPTDISNNSANCGGAITTNDGSYIYVLEKGVCWATHPNPTVMNDSHTENGSGSNSFTASMTDLDSNTLYYVRAYAVTANSTTYGEEHAFVTMEIPTGAINGLFTVSNSKQVYFSQGNLQYIGSSNIPYWKFAENQWDFLGTETIQYSSSQNVDRDLFGWGTSGWNNGNVFYHPYDFEYLGSTNGGQGFGYGPTDGMYYMFSLTGTYANADWGIYNPISNGGNQPNLWRTLTNAEWDYVFNWRTTVSGILYAKAQVNGVNGVILLPDDWSTSYFMLNNTNQNDASFSSNTITALQWNTMEQHGAVFLPAAGLRIENSLIYIGFHGCYWSSSYYTSGHSFGLGFDDSWLEPTSQCHPERYCGHSVRLVRDAE